MRRERWRNSICAGMLAGCACAVMMAIIAPAILVTAGNAQRERQSQGLHLAHPARSHFDHAQQITPLRPEHES